MNCPYCHGPLMEIDDYGGGTGRCVPSSVPKDPPKSEAPAGKTGASLNRAVGSGVGHRPQTKTRRGGSEFLRESRGEVRRLILKRYCHLAGACCDCHRHITTTGSRWPESLKTPACSE